jgi:hypothetical protein
MLHVDSVFFPSITEEISKHDKIMSNNNIIPSSYDHNNNIITVSRNNSNNNKIYDINHVSYHTNNTNNNNTNKNDHERKTYSLKVDISPSSYVNEEIEYPTLYSKNILKWSKLQQHKCANVVSTVMKIHKSKNAVQPLVDHHGNLHYSASGKTQSVKFCTSSSTSSHGNKTKSDDNVIILHNTLLHHKPPNSAGNDSLGNNKTNTAESSRSTSRKSSSSKSHESGVKPILKRERSFVLMAK